MTDIFIITLKNIFAMEMLAETSKIFKSTIQHFSKGFGGSRGVQADLHVCYMSDYLL